MVEGVEQGQVRTSTPLRGPIMAAGVGVGVGQVGRLFIGGDGNGKADLHRPESVTPHETPADGSSVFVAACRSCPSCPSIFPEPRVPGYPRGWEWVPIIRYMPQLKWLGHRVVRACHSFLPGASWRGARLSVRVGVSDSTGLTSF